MVALSFILIASCSNLELSPKVSSNTLLKNEPDPLSYNMPSIPFHYDKAFFPLEKDLSGVYYSWRECKKRFIICLKWEQKKISFKFDDKQTLKFFKDNDFGLIKRQSP